MSPARDFEALVMPHLDAAYNFARWLLRDDASAEDVVQEACLRAFRYFASFRGGDARPWLLGIVRNLCFTQLDERRRGPTMMELSEDSDGAVADATAARSRDPAEAAARSRERVIIDRAIRSLAPAFREVIVLRELQGLSYDEIAEIAGIPIGTVMSRLSRARALMKAMLIEAGMEGCDER
jgi:RNA polymerase sigma factor (sigma-70 family)